MRSAVIVAPLVFLLYLNFSCVGTDCGEQDGTCHPILFFLRSGSSPQQPAGPSETLPVAGAFLWLKANAGVTTSGSSVTSWEDQSGSGNHVYSQSAPYGPPTYVTGVINGKPVIRFSAASANVLQGGSNVPFFTSAAQGLTTFAVFSTTDGNTQRFILALTYNHCVGNFEFGFSVDQTNDGNFGVHRGCGLGTISAGGTILAGINYMMTLRALPSGAAPANIEIFRNGTSLPVGTANLGLWLAGGGYDTSAGLPTIGARFDGVWEVGGPFFDAYQDGDIAEVIVYRNNLSDAERILVECFLAGKYGLSYAGTCP